MITNRAIYSLNFHRYEGKISETIRLDDDRKIVFKTLQQTTNLKSTFPMMNIRNQKELLRDSSHKKGLLQSHQDTTKKLELVHERGAVSIDEITRKNLMLEIRYILSLVPKELQKKSPEARQEGKIIESKHKRGKTRSIRYWQRKYWWIRHRRR